MIRRPPGSPLFPYTTLFGSGERAARLSELPRSERERSARLQSVWRPLGVERELRVTFSADGACWGAAGMVRSRSEEHTSELQSRQYLVCRLLLEKKIRSTSTSTSPSSSSRLTSPRTPPTP